jgi:hypothetical protein
VREDVGQLRIQSGNIQGLALRTLGLQTGSFADLCSRPTALLCLDIVNQLP